MFIQDIVVSLHLQNHFGGKALLFDELMSTKISHLGIVDSIMEGCVKVRILQTSSCASCKVAGHCNASESKEKIVDVLGDFNNFQTLKVGDSVVVIAFRDVASRALLLGFGVPFLILVVVLVITLRLTTEEGFAALASLLALVPYYLFLYFFRDRIRQRLSFQIEQNHLN